MVRDNGSPFTMRMETQLGETRQSGKISPFIGNRAWTNFLQHSVNGGTSTVVDQPNTGGGNVLLSVPVKLNLKDGSNSLTFSAGQSSEFVRSNRRNLQLNSCLKKIMRLTLTRLLSISKDESALLGLHVCASVLGCCKVSGIYLCMVCGSL